jgi:hypothetical protein
VFATQILFFPFGGTVVNFTNILQAAFCANILLPKKLHSQTVIREKLHKALSNKSGWHKMLVKSTPALHQITANFTKHFVFRELFVDDKTVLRIEHLQLRCRRSQRFHSGRSWQLLLLQLLLLLHQLLLLLLFVVR